MIVSAVTALFGASNPREHAMPGDDRGASRADVHSGAHRVERVTTIAPFPRGLAVVDGTLYVLCRGRVCGAGGVSAAIRDQAGTIYAVDMSRGEPVTEAPVSDAVRRNGTIVALPTDPPFHLWDRSASPPERDTRTDRPYCVLRYDDATDSFYICAFSGIDRQRTAADPIAFSKNRSDGILRYDRRIESWSVVDRHRLDSATYPHHDPATNAPPHGWLEGPDNCLPVGRWLYAVAKDNSRLVAYDLSAYAEDPNATPPDGHIVLEDDITLTDGTTLSFTGHSALAHRDEWLYVGSRTSSHIIRVRLGEDDLPRRPIRAELLATFEPFNRETWTSADITDMTFDDAGRLYVVCARPARVHRFTPNPAAMYDGRTSMPWLHLAESIGAPATKAENVLAHDGWLYITTGNGYEYQAGAAGTVYRVPVDGCD